MDGAILITGKQSSFTDDLVQESLGRRLRVFATHDAGDTAPEVPDSFGDTLRYIPWTRRSVISARSMLLNVERESDGVERAVVVCAPEGVNKPLHQTESAVIDESIDVSLKGYLFVIKEIIAYFARLGGGDLTVVWYDGGSEIVPPLDASLAGAVQSLTRSLLAFYENESVTIRGLQASDSDGRAVARWVLDHAIDRADKSAGRWQKYGQKMGLLPFKR